MHHTGTLYVSDPTMSHAHDGAGNFHMQFFACDQQNPYHHTPWCLLWQGTQAQAFFEQHKATGLPVGMALHVTCKHARPHKSGYHGTHILAHVLHCEPVPHAAQLHTNHSF